MNQCLEKLADGARSILPGWPVEVVHQAERNWMQTPEQEVAQLAATLAGAYPEAGRHYWAFRTWCLLVWQPVYLTVAGVHLAQAGIRQECIGQRAGACTVWGCRIVDHVPFAGGEVELLETAAPPLRAAADRLWATCARAMGLHPKAAGRLLADYVTSAIVKIAVLRPDWSNDDAVAWGERWLRGLHLAGAGGFLRYRDSDGGERLAIERKICCLVYRMRDGCLCDTCPRLPPAERLALLSAR